MKTTNFLLLTGITLLLLSSCSTPVKKNISDNQEPQIQIDSTNNADIAPVGTIDTVTTLSGKLK